ncbi:MFS transporter [Streptomyces ochraceiscleroticus]|uniref:MFS transporter n=1 Tax=Streptomyces ochraceiscleroticus TaxID=47761 RepID=A0ABW1MKE5_9ACTN|nr:MFS transporter [Streptomyces ochraceiscleroticus]
MAANAVPFTPADIPTSPAQDPRRGLIAVLALVAGSLNGVLLAAAVLTLSIAAGEIDSGRATTVLSVAVTAGGVAQLLGYPLIGRLSDRTLSRLGRRRPYLLAGAVIMTAGGLLEVIARSTPALALAYVTLSVGAICGLVACNAIVPDQVPAEQRGPASAAIGLGAPVGAVLGTFLAQLGQPDLGLMVLFPTGVGVIASLFLAAFMRDRRLDRTERPPITLRATLATFWVNPLRHPSFGLAWFSRFCIFFGVASVNSYQAFYLIKVLNADPATVGTTVLQATLVGTGMALVFSPLAAKISDKVGRRKPFVIVSAILLAIGLGLTALATDFTGFLAAVAIMGIGQSVYFAVDFALITEVLPDRKDTAKDLGIMNLAMSLPSSLVPAIAPTLLAIGISATNPQNFTALFGTGAVAVFIGALAIIPIRRVR